MLQSVDRALREQSHEFTPSARRRPHRRLAATAALAVGAMAVMAAQNVGAPYLAATLLVAAAVYLRYRVTLFRLSNDSTPPLARGLQGYAQRRPEERSPFLYFGKFGAIEPGSAEARMHFELGTLSCERLQALNARIARPR